MAGLDWIVVDWGTSSLRAWAVDEHGAVLARQSSTDGMATLSPEGYEPALLKLVGAWVPERTARPVPVIVCGMAGAKQGWKEAVYRQVPCAPLASGQMTPVTTSDPRLSVSIIPGLCQMEPADVMRGEETQLAGLVARLGKIDATVCMPGTHSKWVRLEDGRVTGFTTIMTGELFAILASHSILRHSMGASGEDREAFLAGVRETLERPESLTAALFSIRASSLLAGPSPEASRSRLSGLLIGAELAVTRAEWESRPVHLVGAGPLASAYADALTSVGAKPNVEDDEALTLAGLAMARGQMEVS